MTRDRPIQSIKPSASFPFANAVVHGGLVYVSGQVGFRPGTTELAGDDLETQILQTTANVDAVLAAAGTDKSCIVKCSIYLKHVERDFAEMNRFYAQWLGTHRPARTTVGANMAKPGILIEIDCIAAIVNGKAE